MSLHISELVWQRSSHKGSELLVLLAIADNADTATAEAYPSIEYLANKTRLSKGGVHAVIKKLLGGAELTIVKKGTKGRATLYRIEVPVLGSNIERIFVRRLNSSEECVQSGAKISSLASAHQPSVEPSVEDLLPSETSSPQRGVVEVYEHWRSKRAKTNARYDKLSPGRRQKIETRLKEFSVDELKLAIDGVALDPWADRVRHDDLTTIFRSHEQVEKFLEMHGHTNGNGATADEHGPVYPRLPPGEQV